MQGTTRRLRAPLVLLAAMLAFAGCETTLRPTTLEADTGRFPTGTTLPDDAWIVRQDVDTTKYKPLAHIRGDAGGAIPSFVQNSFVNMEFFDNVTNRRDLERMVLDRGLEGSVSNVEDLIGLRGLSPEIGDFLVIDFTVERTGSYDWQFEIWVIDPADGEVLVQIRHEATKWLGLDQPLFYPVLNGVKAWLDENSGAAPAAAPAAPDADQG